MTAVQPTLKSFPKPSQLPVPAGAEGWEQLYPYNLVFGNLSGAEDEKFWFCDSQHWPTVFKPFETIGGEFAVKCLGQYNTRHLLIPPANGIEFKIHLGYLYMSPVPVPEDQIAARVPEFERRAATTSRTGRACSSSGAPRCRPRSPRWSSLASGRCRTWCRSTTS
ncbi:hypothetical protein [Blastococcus sp. PRF04-17]|uniref:hypothetical protein n=1 Tax=Blastococcus sp. PRF04-17 TaxID=2933797 RepID=UPI001FF2D22B|nr:hypothetical protein [Blastococcus sp. PRF04-17]UOY02352.1 hypothetical protein MVA48_02910 [Blastococcus sp. PRF04-17]